jgi:monovalent cation:H+ antiporter-2, CPA2 family
MEFLLLREIIATLSVSLVVLIACHRIAVPPVVAFLVSGVLAGPHGLGLVTQKEQIEHLAELGVILLLFTIGVEFSLSSLFRIRGLIAICGAMQGLLTFAVVYLTSTSLGLAPGEAALLGALIPLSSTAIVLKMLHEHAALDAWYGRTSFAILLFQDLMVAPLMLVVPFLADSGLAHAASLPLKFLTGFLYLTCGYFLARWLVPRMLLLIARTHDQELFLLGIVVTCFAIAFLSGLAGLNLAVGALLAGLIISGSEYSHRTLSYVLPFQQLFTTLFFVSIGMLLDARFVVQHFPAIVLLTGAVVIGKALLAAPAAVIFGLPLRVGILSGCALAQVGEFSFVLARSGLRHGVLSPEVYQVFLAVSVLTIATTPFSFKYGPSIAAAIERLPLPAVIRLGWRNFPDRDLHGHAPLEGHVIVVGFGTNGAMVADVAEHSGIPYVGIEIEPDIVHRERAMGRPIIYGDATREAVLVEQGVERAKVVVVGLPDPIAARRVVGLVHALNPAAYIIVRSRLPGEMQELTALGARRVIIEKLEAGAEIASCLLAKYLVPRNEIERLIHDAREDTYEMVRHPRSAELELLDLKLHIPDLELLSFRMSSRAGASIGDLPREGKMTILALKRGGEVLHNPPAHTIIEADDILLLVARGADAKGLREELEK